jgi:hypothetical protein
MNSGYDTDESASVFDLHLTPAGFPAFYRHLSSLRFPLPVAQVLELRSLVNQSVDDYHQAATTPGYRHFCRALLSAIESFGIESRHHNERLLKTLAFIRDLHYRHSVASRDQEIGLRQAMRNNRRARGQSIEYGLLFLLSAILLMIFWIYLSTPAWWVKLATLVSAYLSWDYFHTLPLLDREWQNLRLQLNQSLRNRIDSVNWKRMIHKLALILGFKTICGIEVFRIDRDSGEYEHLGWQ